jgi:anti-anti-sigma regulatory factor
MFRITTSNDSGMTRFIVEGKLAGACVGELEKCWHDAKATEATGSILVDLTGVTLVDASGKELLARMHHDGTGFRVAGIMTKCLVEEIKTGDCYSLTHHQAER